MMIVNVIVDCYYLRIVFADVIYLFSQYHCCMDRCDCLWSLITGIGIDVMIIWYLDKYRVCFSILMFFMLKYSILFDIDFINFEILSY